VGSVVDYCAGMTQSPHWTGDLCTGNPRSLLASFLLFGNIVLKILFFLKFLSLCLLPGCYNLCCSLGFYCPVGFWKFRAKLVGLVPFFKPHSWLHFVLLVLVLFSCFYFWTNIC